MQRNAIVSVTVGLCLSPPLCAVYLEVTVHVSTHGWLAVSVPVMGVGWGSLYEYVGLCLWPPASG